MKVVIITQEDSFTVPKNIEKIIALDFTEVCKIVNINSEQSLVNRKSLFIKGFGIKQTIKMGSVAAYDKMMCLVDELSGFKMRMRPRSLRSVAVKYGIPYEEVTNPNTSEFLESLQQLQPDIVVSYSAPVIFKKKLLSIPKNGCINLHCSFLPNYAGVMPSFWVLANNEKKTGVTVHMMDTKIDNGKICGQMEVPIDRDETMFSLIKKTKEVGGTLMCDVLRQINEGTAVLKDNKVDHERYYTWPTVDDFKKFRKRGGRLI